MSDSQVYFIPLLRSSLTECIKLKINEKRTKPIRGRGFSDFANILIGRGLSHWFTSRPYRRNAC